MFSLCPFIHISIGCITVACIYPILVSLLCVRVCVYVAVRILPGIVDYVTMQFCRRVKYIGKRLSYCYAAHVALTCN